MMTYQKYSNDIYKIYISYEKIPFQIRDTYMYVRYIYKGQGKSIRERERKKRRGSGEEASGACNDGGCDCKRVVAERI